MEKNKTVYQLKVSLQDTKPLIWRKFLVESDIKLPELNDILQVCMGWSNSHLHQFITRDKTYYGVPDPDFENDMLDETKIRLDSLLAMEKDLIIYEYDFGDSWEHKIELVKILPIKAGITLPFCIAGKNACPPEDVGGIPGFYNFVEIMKSPSHPEHEEMLEWYGRKFDPSEFDIDEINGMLH